MSADIGIDAERTGTAKGNAASPASEIERLFRVLATATDEAVHMLPEDAVWILRHAIVASADKIRAAHERSSPQSPDRVARPLDLACVDRWRVTAGNRAPKASVATDAAAGLRRGPYDSAGEWTFI